MPKEQSQMPKDQSERSLVSSRGDAMLCRCHWAARTLLAATVVTATLLASSARSGFPPPPPPPKCESLKVLQDNDWRRLYSALGETGYIKEQCQVGRDKILNRLDCLRLCGNIECT